MTDRVKFLRAIREQPDDDTARLVFADWLDEHADTDRDVATAEFIRVSCMGSRSSAAHMGHKAYPWLDANWKRLVPSLLLRHVERVVRPGPKGGWALDPVGAVRSGREIRLTMRVTVPAQYRRLAGDLCWCYMRLAFRRGFLDRVRFPTQWVVRQLADPIRIDQPLTDLLYLDNRSTTGYAA